MLNNQDDAPRDIHLDLAFITKFGLKLSEGVVLGHLYPRLKRFREPVPYTNKRLCTELPCVTGKRDTMLRHVTVLVERGLLIKESIRGVQYLGLRGDCGWAAYDSNEARVAAESPSDASEPTDINLTLTLSVDVQRDVQREVKNGFYSSKSMTVEQLARAVAKAYELDLIREDVHGKLIYNGPHDIDIEVIE